MSPNIPSLTTLGVTIEVETSFLPDQSSVDNNQFAFAYRITIKNESDFTVQLTHRKWEITDGIGSKRRVEGEGVVGFQPILAPGQQHTYISGCTFNTRIGKMEGCFKMLRVLDNSTFDACIPSFILEDPSALN